MDIQTENKLVSLFDTMAQSLNRGVVEELMESMYGEDDYELVVHLMRVALKTRIKWDELAALERAREWG